MSKGKLKNAIPPFFTVYIIGANNYLYCHNNPINHIDPLGLKTKSDADKEWQEQNKKKYDRIRKHIDRLKSEGKNKSAGIHEKRLQGYYDKHYEKLGADGYTVYSDDFKKVIQKSTRSPKDGGARESAFIIQKGNTADPELFEETKGSKKHIEKLRKEGYDINILNVDENTDYHKPDPNALGAMLPPQRNVIDVINNALKNINNLGKIQIYSHKAQDINLTNNTIITSMPYTGKYIMKTSDFKISHPSSKGVTTDIFACNYAVANSQVGINMAKASNSAVREAKPGYSVNFPNGAPRAKVHGASGYSGSEGWVTRKPDGTSGTAKDPYREVHP